jgi:Ser-tRNA(Ala) deacylase AlaX
MSNKDEKNKQAGGTPPLLSPCEACSYTKQVRSFDADTYFLLFSGVLKKMARARQTILLNDEGQLEFREEQKEEDEEEKKKLEKKAKEVTEAATPAMVLVVTEEEEEEKEEEEEHQPQHQPPPAPQPAATESEISSIQTFTLNGAENEVFI